MNHSITVRIVVVALWLNLPSLVLGEGPKLRLKKGLYVEASVRCEDPPFAAMRSWSGTAFSGPHSSGCTTRVQGQEGNTFHITTACTALGDGTPLPGGQVDVEDFSLIRLSKIRFVEFSTTKPKRTYRWCGVDQAHRSSKGSKP